MMMDKKQKRQDTDNEQVTVKRGWWFSDPEAGSTFADNVNCQGLKQIFEKDSGIFRRVIWLTIVFCGISMSVYQIQDRIRYYISEPLSTDVGMVCPSSVRFPVVTVCNYNLFVKDVFLNAMGEYGVQTIKDIMPLIPGSSKPNFTQFTRMSENMTSEQWMMIYSATAHKKEDMILQCSWRGQKCTPDDFSVTMTDMGVCYSFNANFTLSSDTSGAMYGLSLALDTQQDQYMRGFAGPLAGFKIMVHSPDDPPLMSRYGFGVTPGTHTFAALDMTSLSNLDKSNWGKCDESATLKYYSTYSLPGCVMECLTEYIEARCNCTMFYMPGNYRTCDPKECFECFVPTYFRFIQERGQCNDICQIACETDVYEVSLSQSPMANYFYEEYANITGKSSQYWKENFVKIDVFFKDISYQKVIQRQAYSEFGLCCDIGGALGLLLGAGILTLFEIFDVLILLCFSRRTKTGPM